MIRDALVGTWRLVRWENRSADGRVTYPLGKDAQGILVYGDDGYMFVAIMRAERAPFAADDLLGGSVAEKARAAETYVSYCGRYDVEDDRVVHHVELSLFPNWVGAEQERLVEITEDRLTLRTRPLLLEGARQTACLVWERVRG